MTFPKHKRFTSLINRKKVKERGCIICGREEVDVCHVKTRASGGGDHLYNMFAACRRHHSEQHTFGLKKFSDKYFMFFAWLSNNGWYFDENNKLKRTKK